MEGEVGVVVVVNERFDAVPERFNLVADRPGRCRFVQDEVGRVGGQGWKLATKGLEESAPIPLL